MGMHTKCGVDRYQLKQVFLYIVKEGWWSQSALVQLLQRSSTAFQDLFPTEEAHFSFPLSLSEVTNLCKQPPSPIPSHPLAGTAVHHTLSSAHHLWPHNREGRREEAEKGKCCHRKEQGEPQWDQVYNTAAANRYKCDCPGTTREE